MSLPTTNWNELNCTPIGLCVPCTEEDKKTQFHCSGFVKLQQWYECTIKDPLDRNNSKITHHYDICPEEIYFEKISFFSFQTLLLISLLITLIFIILRKRKLRAIQFQRLHNQINS
ncbi:hypothetical protein K502DRAFT_365654 [Neoconidiobolus thromboides FSU 785]|nr:hypothetical protein K502DRAFT_365654 [Neoconidiobolus thromboides FSU 785]